MPWVLMVLYNGFETNIQSEVEEFRINGEFGFNIGIFFAHPKLV